MSEKTAGDTFEGTSSREPLNSVAFSLYRWGVEGEGGEAIFSSRTAFDFSNDPGKSGIGA